MKDQLINECRRLGIKIEIYANDLDITVTLINDGQIIYTVSSDELKYCVEECTEFIKELGL